MTDLTAKSAGFLGRGPLFWIAMTFVSTAVVVALALTKAIESKGVILTLMVTPIIPMFFAFRAMLNKNEAGSGNCVTKGEAQRNYIKRVAIFTSLYLASFAVDTQYTMYSFSFCCQEISCQRQEALKCTQRILHNLRVRVGV